MHIPIHSIVIILCGILYTFGFFFPSWRFSFVYHSPLDDLHSMNKDINLPLHRMNCKWDEIIRLNILSGLYLESVCGRVRMNEEYGRCTCTSSDPTVFESVAIDASRFDKFVGGIEKNSFRKIVDDILTIHCA